MPKQTALTIPMLLDGIKCQVRVSFTPGRPAIGPSYSHGGLPPEPAEAEPIEFLDSKGSSAPWLEAKFNKLSEEAREDFLSELDTKAEEEVINEEASIQEEREQRRREDR